MIVLSLVLALSGAFSVLFSSVTTDVLCTFMCSYIRQSTILASLHRIPLLNPVFLALDYICEPAPVPKMFAVALRSNHSRADRSFDDDSTQSPDPAQLGQAYLIGLSTALLLILVLNLSHQFVTSGSKSLLETDEPATPKNLTVILEGDIDFLEQVMAQICQISNVPYSAVDLDAGLPQTLSFRQPGLDATNATATPVFDTCTGPGSTADTIGPDVGASLSAAPGTSAVSEIQLADPEHAGDEHADQQAVHDDTAKSAANDEQASNATFDMPSRGPSEGDVLSAKAEDVALCSKIEEAVLSPEVGQSDKVLQLRNRNPDYFSAESMPAVDRTCEALALCVMRTYSGQDNVCDEDKLVEALDLPVQPQTLAELRAALEAEASANNELSADCDDLVLVSAPAPDVLEVSDTAGEHEVAAEHAQERAPLPVSVSTGGHCPGPERAQPVDRNSPEHFESLFQGLERSDEKRKARLASLPQDPALFHNQIRDDRTRDHPVCNAEASEEQHKQQVPRH